MLACGLATHYVHSTKLLSLEELCKADSGDGDIIGQIIDKYAEQPVIKEKSAYRQLHIIDKCFSSRTIDEILSVLETEAAKRNDECIIVALESMKKAFPTSLKISIKSGCRAILVDKDKNPKWEPSRLDLVDNSMVDNFFRPVNDEAWTELKFPVRSNLPSSAMSKL